MANLTRLPFQLAQAFDSVCLFDDFLQLERPRLQATYVAATKSAGTSLSATAFYTADRTVRIDSVEILPDGSSAGIDNSDTSTWTVKNGSATVASKTYNATTLFPASHVQDNLGTISAPVVQAGGYLTLTVTNGTTAATPATVVSVGFSDLSALGGWAAYLPNGGNANAGNAQSGILTLTPSDPNGTPAASDEAYFYVPQTLFQPLAGYPIYFESYVQYTEANVNNAGTFVGIASGVSAGGLITSGAAGIRNSGTVVGFYKIAGGTTWHVIAQNGSGNVFTADTGIAAGVSTYQRLTFEILDTIAGNATVVFRIDGELVRNASTPQVPLTFLLPLASDVLASLCVGVKNGSSTMETLNVDYLGIVQSRIVGADG